MPDKTFKLVELVGVSEESVQQAVRNAIKRAAVTLKGLSWFEVTQIRGLIADGDVSQFQVTLKVGFRLLGDEDARDG
jgi:flavin-binding protein dodecin